jgi:hypothetical protein
MVSPTNLSKWVDQVQKVDELIVGISRSNGFVTDLVCLEMQRRALLNAIALGQAEQRKNIVDLDLWRKAVVELNVQLSHWMCPQSVGVFSGGVAAASADASVATESQAVAAQTPSSGSGASRVR